MTSDGEPSEPYAAVEETHSAAVYFADERAYKLKKPVRTGFLDFTTAQARAEACCRKTELNRRFAPDVYLGVGEFRALAADPAEPLVVMRRMPYGRKLATLIRAGRLAAAADPWPDATPIDTSRPGSQEGGPLQRALAAIRPYGPEHAWHAARPYMLPD